MNAAAYLDTVDPTTLRIIDLSDRGLIPDDGERLNKPTMKLINHMAAYLHLVAGDITSSDRVYGLIITCDTTQQLPTAPREIRHKQLIDQCTEAARVELYDSDRQHIRNLDISSWTGYYAMFHGIANVLKLGYCALLFTYPPRITHQAVKFQPVPGKSHASGMKYIHPVMEDDVLACRFTLKVIPNEEQYLVLGYVFATSGGGQVMPLMDSSRSMKLDTSCAGSEAHYYTRGLDTADIKRFLRDYELIDDLISSSVIDFLALDSSDDSVYETDDGEATDSDTETAHYIVGVD